LGRLCMAAGIGAFALGLAPAIRRRDENVVAYA
jgi:hypothetical protein